ncbi:ribosomal protein S18-alanine N-acetyltransferase [Kroppenstedtia pulmonis]|uniref:[Ribosomal protein bS18]-alanine N-acetyltransferase n=1 Tax=Kroppenstedtia pulmonis TaxID=1380685 RepID=A0A7D3XJV1_9BACL|nr:ribosomal protein S18-alanine N-acetyltransferase [Kroppenstedtia pulmonis]QKG85424.1 ribosomal protein S18-alanine N-acetyltransferase [Kroppenstedtia pulmonis]
MDHSPINFRFMVLGDIPAVLQVEHASFTTPWTRQAFYNELAYNQFARYIVVEKDRKVIGYGGSWIILDEAHITNIAIHPDYQGVGIGNATLDFLMEAARQAGAEKMTLEVRVSNHVAQSLYKKKGFVETGIRPGYYTDNQEDAIIMWVKLNEK